MGSVGKYKGIIFDMDNTILQSRINFPAMKLDIFNQLIGYQVLDRSFPMHEHTIATLLEACRDMGNMSREQEQAVWTRVAQWEREGMHEAGLEPGAIELLSGLKERYHLVILTNNARQAAVEALETTGTIRFFEHIVGREQMGVLKPSPAGIHHILSLYPDTEMHEWVSVGDAWIDGKAAQQAGVAFIQYRSKTEEFAKREIPSLGRLESLMDLHVYL
jgi:phosphoglycolate phosphatase